MEAKDQRNVLNVLLNSTMVASKPYLTKCKQLVNIGLHMYLTSRYIIIGMCVSMHACVRVCMRACVCVLVRMHACMHSCARTRLHACMHVFVHACVHTCVCEYVRVWVCVIVHVCARARVRVYSTCMYVSVYSMVLDFLGVNS